jgi:hypothetical protein
MALVLDTGPILALLDADDPHHEACANLVEGAHEQLVLVGPTLVEVEYWIRKRLRPVAWRTLVEDIAAGAYSLEQLDERDLIRTVALTERYADMGLGLVDASVIAVCERLGERKVATLDRRHFGAVRPRHCKALRLVP